MADRVLRHRRWTASLTVAATMLLLLAVLYVAARVTTYASFEELESEATVEDVERVERAYEGSLGALEMVATDWALWDDSYAFVAGELPEYADINLLPDTLANLDIDMMAFYDGRGALVHLVSEDVDSREALRIAEQIGWESEYPASVGSDWALTGLVGTSSDPLMYAVAPITTSLGDAPPNGALLVGRHLDDDFIDELAEATNLEVALIVPPDSQMSLAPPGEPVVSILGPQAIAGTVVLGDADEQPLAQLRVVAPRAVMDEGRRSLATFGIMLAVIGLTSSGVMLHGVSREGTAMAARLEAERDARRVQERYRTLVDSMADAVFGVDADGYVFFANPRAAKLTGRPAEELVGLHYRDLLTPDSATQIGQSIERDHDGIATWEATLTDAQGQQIPVEIGVAWFQEGVEASPRMQWIARDVAERKRFEHELVHLATHDHLTGLFNRVRFEEELEGRLASARRSGTPAVLLWLDLDNFKEVNDSLGHKAGDDILISMALELSRRTRSDSILARLGGDEFGVLMPSVDRGEIEHIADRVLEDIRSMEFVTDGGRVRITPSIGVVVLPDHATTPEEALTRADLAMYRAKRDGRNRACVYRPDEGWEQELRARFDWGMAIESSLREDRFVVHWQPIIDLESGELDRYELLIRMLAEDGTLVPPGSFLPVAEQLGLIGQIDAYMVRRAVELLRSSDEKLRIDMNLSGKALSDPSLLDLIAREVRRADIDPARLGIEITETAAVVDMIQARLFIERLKSIGVRVALDDFGSGFSSFYYLRNLPIDALKIDGMFVRELVENNRDQHVVRSIVELARGLGIATTAECVENQETLDILRSLGISHAQGFHISRPGPIADHEQ